MKIILLSFHIQTIGVQGLSALTIAPDQTAERLRNLMGTLGASEGFYLATCNRIEFAFRFENQVPEDFSVLGAYQPRVFWGAHDVARHLLEVALSKDSLVFGESQIMGQLKQAFQWALDEKLVGPVLERMLNLVLRESKKIRTALGLSSHHTSVSTVAGRELIGDLKNSEKALLLVGAGETHQILARYLSKRGFQNFYWTNRTVSKGEQAARQLGGKFISWSDFEKGRIPPEVKFLSCATAAGGFVVSNDLLQKMNPEVVIDLSVPANVDRKEARAIGARYFGLDEMNQKLSTEKALYEEILEDLNAEIDVAIDVIASDLHLRRLNDVFADSVKAAEQLHKKSLEKELPLELSDLSEEQQQALEKWSKRMVQKIIHSHLEILKQVAQN